MTAGGDRGPSLLDYRVARIAAAATLIAVIVFLVVYDALDPDYEVNGQVLLALLVSVLALLGLEAADILKGS